MKLSIAGLPLLLVASAGAIAAEPLAPTEPIILFNGRDLTGLSRWLKETQHQDPQRVFRITDGMLHVSGEDFGYLATERTYRDYRAVLEYKWGKKTDGGKYVRNSGLLVHARLPHTGGTWPPCIECQLAQGCNGDLIPIGGKDAAGEHVPVQFTSDVTLGPDKRPRWTEKGEPKLFTKQQLWWNQHDPTFAELLDTRGKDDVESPLGEWTRVEVICAGRTLDVKINGRTVNKAYDVSPAAGQVLLQSEGFELWVRKWELLPLKP